MWRLPFPKSTITSPFGYRTYPYEAYHSGVDFGSNNGKAIPAPSSGVVVSKGYNGNTTSGWGHYLWVRATDGAYYGIAHMRNASTFNVGNTVQIGATLGYVGASGAAATYGPHCHLSVSTGTQAQATSLDRNHLVDPIQYIEARTGSTAGEIEEIEMLSDQDKQWIHDAIVAILRSAEFSKQAYADTLLATVIDANVGKVSQAIRDARQISAQNRDAIQSLPTNGEMGQALTSTVSLVNEHADANKQEILNAIDDIPGGGTSGGNYSLSLNIDGVPGTATGTATAQ